VRHHKIDNCRRYGTDSWEHPKEGLEELAVATIKTVGNITPSAWAGRRRNQADQHPAA
jgi:hypothetical protein